ncbi:MAG: chorismate mutase [Pseudomonadota bacterium]
MTFTPTAPIVAQCESLDEVRIRIDQADRQLVALLAERAQYVQQAARFKRDAQEVQAPQRVQQVIERALAQAHDVGAPTAVVEATYRAMIAAFIEDEHRHFEQMAAHA